MRPLSTREKFLLCVLLIIGIVSAYFALFFQPITNKKAELDEQIAVAEEQLIEDQIKVSQLEKMRAELAKMHESGKPMTSLAPYDNLQFVIVELNEILSPTSDYSLNFGTVDTSESIVRRNIALNFSARSYSQAKAVLKNLRNCRYRCLLSDISLRNNDNGGKVNVSVTMTFFEIQEPRQG